MSDTKTPRPTPGAGLIRPPSGRNPSVPPGSGSADSLTMWQRQGKDATGPSLRTEKQQALLALRPHRIGMVRAWKGPRADLVGIACDGPLDPRAEVPVAFDEFGHPRRQPQHV